MLLGNVQGLGGTSGGGGAAGGWGPLEKNIFCTCDTFLIGITRRKSKWWPTGDNFVELTEDEGAYAYWNQGLCDYAFYWENEGEELYFYDIVNSKVYDWWPFCEELRAYRADQPRWTWEGDIYYAKHEYQYEVRGGRQCFQWSIWFNTYTCVTKKKPPLLHLLPVVGALPLELILCCWLMLLGGCYGIKRKSSNSVN